MTYLFHTEIFMPASAKSPLHKGALRYTNHALSESQKDRFGDIKLPVMFDPETAQLIESELSDDGSTVIKQVWRQPLDDKRDLVLALGPNGCVKTVWINLKRDKHRTLDRSKYVRP